MIRQTSRRSVSSSVSRIRAWWLSLSARSMRFWICSRRVSWDADSASSSSGIRSSSTSSLRDPLHGHPCPPQSTLLISFGPVRANQAVGKQRLRRDPASSGSSEQVEIPIIDSARINDQRPPRRAGIEGSACCRMPGSAGPGTRQPTSFRRVYGTSILQRIGRFIFPGYRDRYGRERPGSPATRRREPSWRLNPLPPSVEQRPAG